MELTEEHIEFGKRQARVLARRWPTVPLEELEQESSIIMWRLMRDYDPARNDNWRAFAWPTVHSHLLRRCEQWHRWTARHYVGDIREPAQPTAAADDTDTPEQQAKRLAVRRLISFLSPAHASIIAEHFFEDRSLGDIAKARGESLQRCVYLYGEACAAMRAMHEWEARQAS